MEEEKEDGRRRKRWEKKKKMEDEKQGEEQGVEAVPHDIKRFQVRNGGPWQIKYRKKTS